MCFKPHNTKSGVPNTVCLGLLAGTVCCCCARPGNAAAAAVSQNTECHQIKQTNHHRTLSTLICAISTHPFSSSSSQSSCKLCPSPTTTSPPFAPTPQSPNSIRTAPPRGRRCSIPPLHPHISQSSPLPPHPDINPRAAGMAAQIASATTTQSTACPPLPPLPPLPSPSLSRFFHTLSHPPLSGDNTGWCENPPGCGCTPFVSNALIKGTEGHCSIVGCGVAFWP